MVVVVSASLPLLSPPSCYNLDAKKETAETAKHADRLVLCEQLLQDLQHLNGGHSLATAQHMIDSAMTP